MATSAKREAMNAERQNGMSSVAPARSSFIIHHSSFPARPAFTLVELMMSLIIMGILMSMLGVAISFALNRARQAQVSAEVSNLDVALQSYKNQFGGEYPPCMGVAYSATAGYFSPSRDQLFERALRKRFPRFTQLVVNEGHGAQTFPATYDNIATWLMYQYTGSTNMSNYKYNLKWMDPAEALVFWLAGPPALPSSPGTSKIAGFNPSQTNPFNIPVAGATAAPALFEFSEDRLTDYDQDGWLEYIPQGTSNKTVQGGGTGMAPYVYFDAASYTYNHNNQQFIATSGNSQGFLPPNPAPFLPFQSSGISETAGTYPGEFGVAMPYLMSFVKAGSVYKYTFWNAKKFQLIAPGQDSDYGASVYDLPPEEGSAGGGRPFAPLIPQTSAQVSGTLPPGAKVLQTGDADNVTNFIDGKLEDYSPQ